MTLLAPLLSGLTLIAASALLPGLSPPPTAALGHVGTRGVPLRMAAEPTQKRGRWMRRLRSGGATVAAAAVLAMPRAPAQAAELASGGAVGVSRDVGTSSGSGRRRQLPPAFLGFARKRTLDKPLDSAELRGNHIDMDALVSKKMAKRFVVG